MARGELARPVPPSGEADEIGRLTFAFEEMRRALRDKLRSTESLNIDLEREVRRRTEVLEQRNVELRDALEKLRRAQDDLIRTEKLASMGRLVAGIAHEINNPVNAVINTLGPLEEAIHELTGAPDPAAADARVQEMLRVVQRGAARSKAIVQALHNYSRGDEETPRELALGAASTTRWICCATGCATSASRRTSTRASGCPASPADRSGVHEPHHERRAGDR